MPCSYCGDPLGDGDSVRVAAHLAAAGTTAQLIGSYCGTTCAQRALQAFNDETRARHKAWIMGQLDAQPRPRRGE